MIETIHELLVAMKEKGIEDIEPYLNIGHNPTIGEMYEGLTHQLMERTIFKDFNMHVVSGKIINASGKLSKQIDCMIVIGEGEKLPYTDNYIYNINNVIAVIEVKKKLFSNDLSDAYNNLKSVVDITTPDRDLKIDMIRDAFTSISKMEFPNRDQLNFLEEKYQMLYHILIVECLLPIRVIFGYEGFSSEKSLRDKFVEYISRQADSMTGIKKGFGAHSLPNLIIAKENSLIKTNGMPYSITFNGGNEYCWIASYRRNPLLIFLELLWTRLTYMYDISTNIFGFNLIEEALIPLLTANGTKRGWEYTVIEYSEQNMVNMDKDAIWQPTILSQGEFILLNLLCQGEKVIIDERLENWAKNLNENIQYIIEHLNNERLIYCENGFMKLLTKECKCVILPDKGYCAADDYDGRLTRWLMKYQKNIS
jgi:hypothetical protein